MAIFEYDTILLQRYFTYIHTYITYKVHFRQTANESCRHTDVTHTHTHTQTHTQRSFQTDRHTTDESRRQTDSIHTYIHTYARTCLSVRPIVCLLVHVSCLSACPLPTDVSFSLSAFLSVDR